MNRIIYTIIGFIFIVMAGFVAHNCGVPNGLCFFFTITAWLTLLVKFLIDTLRESY